MKRINFVDLPAEHAEIKNDIEEAIFRTISSGRFVLGEEVYEFERAFSTYIGTKHSVAVNSGSDGLYLALRALGIKEGDEVITVANTYVSTVDAIIRNGALPVFVDVDPYTYNMDTEHIENKITGKTKAIIPVHLYGQPARMDRIMEIAGNHNLLVVEDACQAHGATFRGNKVGSFGDAGVFSFYPTKNLGAYGDGGVVVTSNHDVYEKLLMLRNNGQKVKYEHQVLGINSRLDELQASILKVKLQKLDQWNERRREVATLYKQLIGEHNASLPFEIPESRHVFHLFVMKVRKRENFMSFLKQNGITTMVHYPIPVHRQKYYRMYADRYDLPVTERLSEEIVSLPMHPFLTLDEIQYVSNNVSVAMRFY